MTVRSIFSGNTPEVIIRAGGSVTVQGYEGDRVQAETSGQLGLEIKRKAEAIQVALGRDGLVQVPAGSSVKVYAGKNAEVQAVSGRVSAYAGDDIRITECGVLEQASAGKRMEIDCRQVEGRELKLSAGRDLRFWIRELADVRYFINDLGGKWQAVFGDGSTHIELKAGGDVIIVSDHDMLPQPADAVTGRIDRPTHGSTYH